MSTFIHPSQPFEPGAEYVLGFAFLPSTGGVLLIKKTRPDWQAGKLNGVGGKVEPDDWCLAEAMRREFKEETNIDTEVDSWTEFGQHLKLGSFNGDLTSYSLHLFSTVLSTEQCKELEKTTDEEPIWFGLESINQLLDGGVPGCAMYLLTAHNHLGRSYFTTTTEE